MAGGHARPGAFSDGCGSGRTVAAWLPSVRRDVQPVVLALAALETRLQLIESARRIAQRAVEELAHSGIRAQLRVRDGSAGDEIVKEACEWPADLIVLGSPRRSIWRRLLLGSVANYVLRRAPCSLEIVRGFSD